jgi:hypothetical protein
MLNKLLAKLGLRSHAGDESYSAETTSKTARRVQDGIDSSQRKPPAGDPPSGTSGEESPASDS